MSERPGKEGRKNAPGAAEEFPDYEVEGSSDASGWWARVGSVWLVLGVVGLVLIGAALWLSPRLYDRFKEARALRFAGEAREAEQAGDLRKASASYRQAFLIAGNSPKVRRAALTFSAKLGDPAALKEMTAAMKSGSASAAEILSVAEGSLLTGDKQGALAAMELLRGKSLAPEEAFARLKVEIRLKAGTGRDGEALQTLMAEIDRRPMAEADELRLLGAEILLETARRRQDLAAAQKARDLFLAIRGNGSRVKLNALRALAQLDLAGVDLPDRAEVIGGLRDHPLHEQIDVLLAATMELRDLTADRKAVIARVKGAYGSAEKAERLAAARWLIQQRAQEDALEFIGEEQALAESEFFLVYGDALSGLGRWTELRDLLEAHSVPGMDESIRHLFLMRAAMQLDDAKEVAAQWREVSRYLRLADPKTALYVARYAETIGAKAEAANVFQTLAARSDAPLEALIGYLKYAPSDTEVADLLPVYERILRIKPEFPEAENDYAYLRLLLDRDSAEILPEARRRYESTRPPSLAYVTTLALAELRQGDARAADQLYSASGDEMKMATDAQRAVRARVLWETGQRDAAQALAATIERKALRSSERKLLEGM